MNAFNMVNLAAACLLTSTAKAKELGIPESKWIYPLAGAGTQDSNECRHPSFRSLSSVLFSIATLLTDLVCIVWQRSDYHSSPALSKSIDACLRSSGLTKDDIDLCDIYS